MTTTTSVLTEYLPFQDRGSTMGKEFYRWLESLHQQLQATQGAGQ